jgi:hypothetical protein
LVYISITFIADINITPSSYTTGFRGSSSSSRGKPPYYPTPIGRYKGQVSYIFLIPYLELIPPEGKVKSVGN